VLSNSDGERIDLKRKYYRAHIHNRAILLIRQDRQELELDLRDGVDWVTAVLRGPDATLVLRDLGFSCPLGALYRKTALQPT
jgi:Uma2 family endonuclease